MFYNYAAGGYCSVLRDFKKFCGGIGFSSSDTGQCQLLYVLLGREHDRNQIVTQFRKRKLKREF